jgi:hypothetical protein
MNLKQKSMTLDAHLLAKHFLAFFWTPERRQEYYGQEYCGQAYVD